MRANKLIIVPMLIFFGQVALGLFLLKMIALTLGGQIGLVLNMTGNLIFDTIIVSTIEVIVIAVFFLILELIIHVVVKKPEKTS